MSDVLCPELDARPCTLSVSFGPLTGGRLAQHAAKSDQGCPPASSCKVTLHCGWMKQQIATRDSVGVFSPSADMTLAAISKDTTNDKYTLALFSRDVAQLAPPPPTMRLLTTDTIGLQEFPDDATPRYAILSHTWGDEEVSLQDMQGDRQAIAHKKGYEKIVHCCEFSKGEGFDYVWIDTCCIDKTSSAELSEAINSMYLWYESAEICYAYLADVEAGLDMKSGEFEKSRWFTRGWTLQELIAPGDVLFLNKTWGVLGTRESLSEDITLCTGIPKDLLHGTRPLETFSVAQRMSWASGRKTTRVEDRAYSLLGIFGIYMPLIYGEKETAFIRLQEEIMRISDDHSLFAWKSTDTRGGVFATSPDAFSGSGDVIVIPGSSSNTNTGLPVSSSKGIHLELRFKGVDESGLGIVILNCRRAGDRGIPIGIYVRDTDLTMVAGFERAKTESLADLEVLRPAELVVRKICIRKGRVTRARHPQQKLKGPVEGGQVEGRPTAPRAQVPKGGLAARPTLLEAAQNGYEGYIWLLFTQPEFEATKLTEAKLREALTAAVIRGHVGVVRVLIARHEIKGDVWDGLGVTMLSKAVQCGRVEVVEELLKSGKFSADLADKSGRKPLSIAVSAKKAAMVRLLLDSGADFRATDSEGWTPLSRAAGLGDTTTVALLLTARAEVDQLDTNWRTPLSRAAEYGHLEVVKLLIRGGADPHLKELYNDTPFLRAVSQGNEAIVRLMIEWGAVDLHVKDGSGRTPLQLAGKRGHENIVKLLLEYGAGGDEKAETGEVAGKGLLKRFRKK